MLTKFWESAGEGVSGKWIEQLFGPAIIFWGGGLLIIAWRIGFDNVWSWILSLNTNVESALVILGVIILSLSAILITHLRFTALRLLEGYWPWPLSYISWMLSAFQLRRMNQLRSEWNALKDKEEKNKISVTERRRIAELDVRLHYFPPDDKDALPTSLGNTLRAAETAPYYKYGLDVIVCWPRLWLLLPDQVQQDLIDSRDKLDQSVELWVWGFLFLFWAFWSWWAIVVSLIWMILGYYFSMQLAFSHADLLESTFDLYRWELYKRLRWALPKTSGVKEVILGKRITEFLWRGTDSKPHIFYDASEE